MNRNDKPGSKPPSFFDLLREFRQIITTTFRSESPTGWRCKRCGGTESMFESMDPEDPTVEICKRCGHKDRY